VPDPLLWYLISAAVVAFATLVGVVWLVRMGRSRFMWWIVAPGVAGVVTLLVAAVVWMGNHLTG
jgi:hypothetical protein